MRDRGAILDEQISRFLNNKDTNSIQHLLDFEYEGEVFDETGLISPDFLKNIMIKRDELVYHLKDIKREDGLIYDDLSAELEAKPEEITYNSDMYDANDITVIRASGKDNQPMTFYYYNSDALDHYVNRQLRTQTKDEKFSRVDRQSCFVSNKHYAHPEGKYHAGMSYTDGSLLVTMKDRHGNKQAALYQDDISGCKYYEYDKDGNRVLSVSEEAVEHDVVIDGQTYSVYDGFFDPDSNGYILKKYIKGETIQDIKPSEINRQVNVWDRDLKNKIESSIDTRTQEEVLGILQALDPIFETIRSKGMLIDDMESKKMETLVGWLGNFSKRLKIDPQLVNQDKAVMSSMKNAVSKTIGRTEDAEKDLKTEAREEKEYEGEDYGDN